MTKNVIYTARIERKVFFIHKFSARNPDIESIVCFGLAYDCDGNYSEKYKKALQKYHLKGVDTILNCSFDDMIEVLFYAHNRGNHVIDSHTIYNYVDSQYLEIIRERIELSTNILRKNGFVVYLKDCQFHT